MSLAQRGVSIRRCRRPSNNDDDGRKQRHGADLLFHFRGGRWCTILLRSRDIYTSRIFVCCLTCFVIICFVSLSDSLGGAECVGSNSRGMRVTNFVNFPAGAISTAIPTVADCHLNGRVPAFACLGVVTN